MASEIFKVDFLSGSTTIGTLVVPANNHNHAVVKAINWKRQNITDTVDGYDARPITKAKFFRK